MPAKAPAASKNQDEDVTMSKEQIILNKKEVNPLLGELVMSAGSLSNLTGLYEEMRVDLEGNDNCQLYIDPASLSALQPGGMALAQNVDRSLFEFESVISQAERAGPKTDAEPSGQNGGTNHVAGVFDLLCDCSSNAILKIWW